MTATKTTLFQDTARSHMVVLAAAVAVEQLGITQDHRLYAPDMIGFVHVCLCHIHHMLLAPIFIPASQHILHITVTAQSVGVEVELAVIFA
jgi:hypothetical protein